MPDNDRTTDFASGTFIADQVGALLERVPTVLRADHFDRIVDGVTRAGHWALLVVAVLGLVIQVIGAPSIGATAILWGVGWLIALPLLQYVAVQFLGATRSMVTSNSTTLGSQAFLRCYALVALVGAIVALVGAIGQGIDARSIQVFLYGVGVTALWLATAWLALNPSLLGIRINRQSGAGEEAIGVLSFFAKSAVRIVPIFYGVTMIVAAIQGVVLVVGMVGDSTTELMMAVTRAEFSAPLVILAVLSPFLAYIGFVVYFLVIDLMRGILSLPGSVSAGVGRSGGGAARARRPPPRRPAARRAADREAGPPGAGAPRARSGDSSRGGVTRRRSAPVAHASRALPPACTLAATQRTTGIAALRATGPGCDH
ncbi:MAG: hypothetical protein U5K43_02280 [Halofilum sp. (in: g-proteobacteria)]|nr:hypothetical protein [Halofilum sp. (in: g-proteobacteria)]